MQQARSWSFMVPITGGGADITLPYRKHGCPNATAMAPHTKTLLSAAARLYSSGTRPAGSRRQKRKAGALRSPSPAGRRCHNQRAGRPYHPALQRTWLPKCDSHGTQIPAARGRGPLPRAGRRCHKETGGAPVPRCLTEDMAAQVRQPWHPNSGRARARAAATGGTPVPQSTGETPVSPCQSKPLPGGCRRA